jgi:methionyl-tRNA synthetase
MLTPNMLYWWIFPILLWSAVWKGIALWKSGRNNQIVWFVFIFIFNTAGILPILYLLFFQRKQKVKVVKAEKKPVKKKTVKKVSKKKK